MSLATSAPPTDGLDAEEGYRDELIRGVLVVSPAPSQRVMRTWAWTSANTGDSIASNAR